MEHCILVLGMLYYSQAYLGLGLFDFLLSVFRFLLKIYGYKFFDFPYSQTLREAWLFLLRFSNQLSLLSDTTNSNLKYPQGGYKGGGGGGQQVVRLGLAAVA